MKDIKFLSELMKNVYGAEELPAEEAERWLEDDEKLIKGYCFPDAKKAYYLLTEGDYRMLRKEMQETCENSREYPFKNVAVTVYENNQGRTCLRVTNGFAGALERLFDAWKEWRK